MTDELKNLKQNVLKRLECKTLEDAMFTYNTLKLSIADRLNDCGDCDGCDSCDYMKMYSYDYLKRVTDHLILVIEQLKQHIPELKENEKKVV